MKGALLALWCSGLIAATTACGASNDDEITVFAAASLTDAFAELATEFERAHPGLEVRLNLAGSSTLREQILAGAPADVFAPANRAAMDAIADADVPNGAPATFATNSIALAVPLGNPAGLTEIDDLADETLVVGLCSDTVPCGELARTVLAGVGVDVRPDTTEPDVRALLTKLVEGELDAGLVYRTDIVARTDQIDEIPVPGADEVVTPYPIATIGAAPAAADFVTFVLSDDGRRILADHGFGLP